MPTNRIAVIDDQESVRRALGEILGVYGYDTVLFETAETFVGTPRRNDFACVVSDVRMPGMDGIGLVRALGGSDANPPVILISGQADVTMAVAALKAGAVDFIEKPVNDVQLVAAINRALAHNTVTTVAVASRAEAEARFARLTPREVQVFDMVAEGHTSPSIARNLAISVRTVESYRTQVMEKLGLTSIAGIVRLAIRLGRTNP